MKKTLAVVLAIVILAGALGFVPTFAEDTVHPAFVTLKVPCDNEETPGAYELKARFADSKQAITLSCYYDGYVFATVPPEDAERKIEPCILEEIPFSDYDPSRYEFFAIQELSKTGVIMGNEKGEARPFANVTRAEAVAMVMRFLGLHGEVNYALTFEDVKRDDWFFGVVAAAHNAGIVEGTSEVTFAPHRNVTREEITVMTARAIQYANLHWDKSAGVIEAADIDKISDWAENAYNIVGRSCVSDPDNTDPERPVRVLSPQKPATRYDVAYVLYNTSRQCQLYPSQTATEFGFDKGMPSIDGSTSTYPITEAVFGALFSNGNTHPLYPASHSKSHASYERLINGDVDMLFASVYPASDILELAEEKDVELELIPIAYDAMIFFTNMDNPAVGLTKEQISEIYVNNAYASWSQLGGDDALLYPYCRNYDSGSHAQMERHFLKGNEINEKIRQETTSVTMSNVLTDVMAARTDEPKGYGLGYSIYYYFNNMDMFYNTKTELKLLEIDGVYPTDDTIADGSYPLSNNTYIVMRKDTPENSPVRKMAEFMLTRKGQDCIEAAGYGRLK